MQSMAVNATDGYMKQEIVLVNDAANLNNRGRNHTKSQITGNPTKLSGVILLKSTQKMKKKKHLKKRGTVVMTKLKIDYK